MLTTAGAKRIKQRKSGVFKMLKVFDKVVAKGVKLDKLQVVGHDFTSPILCNDDMTVTISKTAPVIALNKLEEETQQTITFDANNLQAVIDSLTELQNTFKEIKSAHIETKAKIDERKNLADKARQIDLLFNDVKAEQTDLRPRRWLDIYYNYHNNYMCLTTDKYLKCFINIEPITLDDTVAVRLVMQTANKDEALENFVISFDDMQKAFIDLNEAISKIFKKATE